MKETDSERLRKAMEELLSLHGIELPEEEPNTEEEKQLRRGDYSAIISRTQEKLDELNEKAELIYKRLGMNAEQLEAYASNPANFAPEEWKALQKVKEEAENFKRKAQESLGKQIIEKGKEVKEKIKGPKKFGKKKNWISL